METAATKPQPVLAGPTADTIPVSVPGDTMAGDSRGTVTVSFIGPKAVFRHPNFHLQRERYGS